jgi:tRNA (adenine37-N6)-methyltransferase
MRISLYGYALPRKPVASIRTPGYAGTGGAGVLSSSREGEIPASSDPASMPADAHLVFIGRAETPWRDRADCPKNLREARVRGGAFRIVIDGAWRPGLRDLRAGDAIVVLLWMDKARRDLIVQAPRHSPDPKGAFSLRSPVRPNPIGIDIVRIVAIDAAEGSIMVDALDCLDGTPVLDIKPWIEGVDVPPAASAPAVVA